MAEIIGAAGRTVDVSGVYACTMCGHRERFERGGTFPPDHHEGHPWTMMVMESS